MHVAVPYFCPSVAAYTVNHIECTHTHTHRVVYSAVTTMKEDEVKHGYYTMRIYVLVPIALVLDSAKWIMVFASL